MIRHRQAAPVLLEGCGLSDFAADARRGDALKSIGSKETPMAQRT